MHMKITYFLSIATMIVSIENASADQIQLPPLKEGLWESHTHQVIQKRKVETVMKLCRTNALDKSMKSAGEEMRKSYHCVVVLTRQSANSFFSEMHCDKGPLSGSVNKTTMTYQSDTSYRVEQRMTMGQSETVTIIDERYLGSCPSDMKPGDALMADGKKISLGVH
jgi:hypothetical protein